MSIDTVLRIKRKRNEDPLKILLTAEIEGPLGKKRRVWQLSRSSDSRGIPIPIRAPAVIDTRGQEASQSTTAPSPPRFSVRKRKASDSFPSRKSQRIIDLEREGHSSLSRSVSQQEEARYEDNPILNSMMTQYLVEREAQDGSAQKTHGEEEYVYDIYYPQATTEAIQQANSALLSNYGLLEHFDWDTSNNLVVDDDEDKSDADASEDSNAEDWAGNEYPDESDLESHGSEDSLNIQGSDNEFDESYDRNDWD